MAPLRRAPITNRVIDAIAGLARRRAAYLPSEPRIASPLDGRQLKASSKFSFNDIKESVSAGCAAFRQRRIADIGIIKINFDAECAATDLFSSYDGCSRSGKSIKHDRAALRAVFHSIDN